MKKILLCLLFGVLLVAGGVQAQSEDRLGDFIQQVETKDELGLFLNQKEADEARAAAAAQTNANSPLTYKSLVGKASGVLQAAVSVIFWLIFFYVAWTIIQSWARHGNSPAEVKKGKNTLMAGILGLVILGSLWGLVAFVRQVLLT